MLSAKHYVALRVEAVANSLLLALFRNIVKFNNDLKANKKYPKEKKQNNYVSLLSAKHYVALRFEALTNLIISINLFRIFVISQPCVVVCGGAVINFFCKSVISWPCKIQSQA